KKRANSSSHSPMFWSATPSTTDVDARAAGARPADMRSAATAATHILDLSTPQRSDGVTEPAPLDGRSNSPRSPSVARAGGEMGKLKDSGGRRRTARSDI